MIKLEMDTIWTPCYCYFNRQEINVITQIMGSSFMWSTIDQPTFDALCITDEIVSINWLRDRRGDYIRDVLGSHVGVREIKFILRSTLDCLPVQLVATNH